MSNDTILNLAEELRIIADEISYNAVTDTSSDYPKRGTIVKALPSQTRFKPKSVWVSLGNGTYKHITGSKGLITTHERLSGYTEVVFEA
jgi:hypothetical protein